MRPVTKWDQTSEGLRCRRWVPFLHLAFDSIVPYMFLMMLLLYYFMAALLPLDSVSQRAWPLLWGRLVSSREKLLQVRAWACACGARGGLLAWE